MVFTTPLLKALRKGLPDSKIGLLTGSFCAPLVEGQKLVDEVIEFPVSWPPRRPWSFLRGAAFMTGLKRRGYDALLVTHRSLGVRMLCALSGIRRRVGFEWMGDRRFLTEAVAYDPQSHEVDRYLSLLQGLGLKGLKSGDRALSWTVTDSGRRRASALLRSQGMARSKGYAVVMPGGASNPGMKVPFKRWDIEDFCRVSRALARAGHPVLVLGPKGEAEICAATAAAAGGQGHDFCGKDDLGMLPALLAGASVVVGNDSGPLHLAEAVGARTVSVFGPTSPRHYGPLSPGKLHQAFWAGVSCSPCLNPSEGWSAAGRACLDNVCMHEVNAEAVVRAALKLSAPGVP